MTAPAARHQAWLVFPAVPLLGLGYQYCVERLAQATLDQPIGPGWIAALFAQPWTLGVIVLEVGSFIAWMIVLARWPLSAAFPLTSISYGLVIALGWFVLHEPIRPLEIVGSIIILAGFFLLWPARADAGADAPNPHPPQPGVRHASD